MKPEKPLQKKIGVFVSGYMGRWHINIDGDMEPISPLFLKALQASGYPIIPPKREPWEK